jgi:hypothetical protein
MIIRLLSVSVLPMPGRELFPFPRIPARLSQGAPESLSMPIGTVSARPFWAFHGHGSIYTRPTKDTPSGRMIVFDPRRLWIWPILRFGHLAAKYPNSDK